MFVQLFIFILFVSGNTSNRMNINVLNIEFDKL